jgi:imidazole glycerol phosphate synthase glutamine amidotransferase subunit
MATIDETSGRLRKPIAVVTTGIANLASVMAGLRRAGGEPATVQDVRAIEMADYVMLPGVGSYRPAAERLVELGLVRALRERILAGRPTMAICLGMQLFGQRSEEGVGVEGLKVIDAEARRFPTDGGLRVPQLGWNRVEAPPGARFLRSGYAYYANSFRIPELNDDGWLVATTTYGAPFVAAIERQGVLACQFHPELSGAWGLALMKRWLGTITQEEEDAEMERAARSERRAMVDDATDAPAGATCEGETGTC